MLSEAKTSGAIISLASTPRDRLDGGCGKRHPGRGAAAARDTYDLGVAELTGTTPIKATLSTSHADQSDTLDSHTTSCRQDHASGAIGRRPDHHIRAQPTTQPFNRSSRDSSSGPSRISRAPKGPKRQWSWQDVQVPAPCRKANEPAMIVLRGYDSTDDKTRGGAGNDLLIGANGKRHLCYSVTDTDRRRSSLTYNTIRSRPDRILFNADTTLRS